MTEKKLPNASDQNQEGCEFESKLTRAQLKVDTLEPRILLSATWADVETNEEIEGPTSGDDVGTGDDARDYLRGLDGDDALFGGVGTDLCRGGAGSDTRAQCE